MSPQPGAALASAPASTRPPEPMPVQADAATRHLADDRPAGATWGALALLLSLLAAAGALAPAAWQQMLDWQPGLVASQPWRAFSAIAVHYSAWHLVANLAGAAAVTAGMMRYVSSANLQSLLPRVRTSRSPAFITYEAGPMPDPWMILAVMDFCVDI